MKDANFYAREFKLWHCLNSPQFAKQVARIQQDAIQSKREDEVAKGKVNDSKRNRV